MKEFRAYRIDQQDKKVVAGLRMHWQQPARVAYSKSFR